MDLGQLFFPFIMAVITNSIMIVAIYFLRKIPYFANLFGVWFMVILYLFGVLRIFLPIEFPTIQVVLRDVFLYRYLIDGMVTRAEDSYVTTGVTPYILLGVWIAVSIILVVVSLHSQKEKITYFEANTDFTTDEERALFSRISQEILGENHTVTVKKTDAVERIVVAGYRKKYVLLPVGDYSPDELEMIFRHECTHVLNKDLWIKLLVHIYCCIFWWNPFSYLLKLDLGYTLEMKCDLIVVLGLSDDKVKLYFDALTKRRSQEKKDQKKGRLSRLLSRLRRDPFYLNAEFTEEQKNKELVKRIGAIAAAPPKKAGQIVVNVLVSLFFVAIFVTSYIFIWQPFYGPEVEKDEYNLADGAIIVDESNGYLVKQEDGSYLFFYGNYPPEHISREEVEQGLYDYYPILDN